MQKAFIETQFPIARLSAETLKERNSGAGQTLTGLGKWWSKKQLIHVRAIIVRALIPASPNLEKNREIFLKSLPWMTKEYETAKRARFKLENGEMPLSERADAYFYCVEARDHLQSFIGVTIFCGECLPIPNAQPVDDDRGPCRSSANLKTVYEGMESLGEP